MANDRRGWWSKNLWVLVLFPVLAALLLIPVGLLRGWLHNRLGIDADGKPLGESAARARVSVSLADGYRQIATDAKRRDAETRPHWRYLTLWHRHNDPGCTDAELEHERQALRALVAEVARGKGEGMDFIDPEQLIFALNLEAMGWEPLAEWRKLMAQYRYGLTGGADEKLAGLRREVEQSADDKLPVVRGDWFVVAVSRGLGAKVPESVRVVAQRYGTQTLDAKACARELGLEEEGGVLRLVKERPNLQQEFGLAPLLKGERIRREWWESDRNLFSPYQELARLLKLGQPVRVQ